MMKKVLTNTDIDKHFERYEIPNFNWVRLPSIKIKKEEKESLGLAEATSNFEFMKAKAREGFEYRKKHNQILKDKIQDYEDRLEEELSLIDDLSFTDYYLLVWRTIEYARQYTSYIDPARGSCGGSTVLYMLRVTEVDPVRHNLFLSRFISKVRANKKEINGVTYIQGDLAPDIDLNFAKDIRSKIIHWLEEEYDGKMAQISTYGTYTTKILIKEVFKSTIDGATETASKELTDCVESLFGSLDSLEDVYEKSEEFRTWADNNPESYTICKKLRNLPKSIGSHASGFVISFDPLNKVSALHLNKDNELTCVYDMGDISKLSLKLDLLGLTTSRVVEDTLQSIGITYEDINLEDAENIYGHFQNDRYLGTGLYQIEKGTAYKVASKIKPKSVSELSDVNALARPGALAYVQDYVNNSGSCEHKIFEDILKTTRYQPLYQEQMIQMAVALGFTASEGEVIRRCITGDTKFFSKSRGWITIKELLITNSYKDDLFLILDENGKEFWKPINDIWSNGIKQIRYVETKNGNFVKAYKTHQFLTDTGWKARARLSENDYIASTLNIPYFPEKQTVSNHMAIILAGIMTEGYFVKGTATFTNYDKDIYNRFYLACCFELGVENITQRPCGKVISLKKKAQDQLIKYISTGKSAYKEVPDIIFKQPKHIIQTFLSFSFACEGTITEKELSITSKSRKLVQGLQLLFYQFGIRTTHSICKNTEYGNFSCLCISKSKSGKYIKIFIDNFLNYLQDYKITKLKKYYNEHKNNNVTIDDEVIPHTILQKLMNQYPDAPHKLGIASGRLYNGNQQTNISCENFKKLCIESKDKKWINFCNSNLNFSKIKSLEQDIREVEVFDFSIDEETPYIVANGMIIHNCVAKKKKSEIPIWKDKIYKKCEEKGLDKSVGDYFWKLMEDSASYSFNKCIFERERVELESGEIIELRDVKINDSIKCFNTKTSKDEYCKVKNIFKNKKKCYAVEIGSLLIRCSEDHKFLCFEDGNFIMKPLNQMSIMKDDLIVTKNGLSIINYIELDRLRKTIDLEIDSEDHNFYANGIVVSNSHSVGVSYVGALTAYLKYNYPVEFYTAYLNNVREFRKDSIEKTSAAISELGHFGIKILPPNLLKSGDNFTVDNGNIRYGLKFIKGINESSIEKLQNFKQNYDNKFEVFRAIDVLKIPLTAISPLIQAGALDDEKDSKTRTYMVFECQVWKKLTAKEKNLATELAEKFHYDLLAIIRHLTETEKIKESRLNTLRKNTDPYKEIYNQNKKYSTLTDWYYEYKLLGTSQRKLKDVFKEAVDMERAISDQFPFLTLSQACDKPELHQEVRIVGLLKEFTKGKSQKSGNEYLKFLIEDDEDRILVFLMDGKQGRIDEFWNKYPNRKPEENDIIVCRGKLTDGGTMFANEISVTTARIYTKLSELKVAKRRAEKNKK